MSADHKGPLGKCKISQMLDFGPDSKPAPNPSDSNSFTDRLKAIVRKLQELNDRIDQLTSRD